jgi:hypothetical protein
MPHAVMELTALSQDNVGKRNSEAAAFVTEQICKAAPFIVLVGRQIGIGHLADRNYQKPEPESLQYSRLRKRCVVSIQIKMRQVPHGQC